MLQPYSSFSLLLRLHRRLKKEVGLQAKGWGNRISRLDWISRSSELASVSQARLIEDAPPFGQGSKIQSSKVSNFVLHQGSDLL